MRLLVVEDQKDLNEIIVRKLTNEHYTVDACYSGDEALDFMVDKAIEYKLGARGLRSIVENIMIDAMYEIPSTKKKKLNVTKDYVVDKLADTNLDMLSQTID